MIIGVIQFPGTNCERETSEAIRRAGMQPVSHRWNMSIQRLSSYDGFVIAGGFSYEDRSRSGIIAAQDPIMDAIKIESEKGKPVLGICNGAQILVESGMVPGIEGYLPGAALTTNRRVEQGTLLGTGFYNAWITICFDGAPPGCAFTSAMQEGTCLRIPAAHAEGRFLFSDDLRDEMLKRNMILFSYTDEQGSKDPDFPVNPNGSLCNTAAICNASGTVMAMMPHPERTPAGDAIFTSMRQYIERCEARPAEPVTLLSSDYYAPREPLQHYRAPSDAHELVIDLIITDNEAVSVENALRQRGIGVSVSRRTHWEISMDPAHTSQTMERIIASGELFNSNKEFITTTAAPVGSRSLLVRERDDSIGEHAVDALTNWFGIDSITSIRHGVIWTITPDDMSTADEVYALVEQTHLLSSPIAHRSMIYEA